MDYNDKIAACYNAASNYPDLARRLNQIDVESYTVDTASGTILYRFDKGENILHHGKNATRIIQEKYDGEKTIPQ